MKRRTLAFGVTANIGYTSYEGYATASGRDLSPTRIHAAGKTLKSRIAGIDIDFTSESNTGSRLMEIVHVSGTGRYSR